MCSPAWTQRWLTSSCVVSVSALDIVTDTRLSMSRSWRDGGRMEELVKKGTCQSSLFLRRLLRQTHRGSGALPCIRLLHLSVLISSSLLTHRCKTLSLFDAGFLSKPRPRPRFYPRRNVSKAGDRGFMIGAASSLRGVFLNRTGEVHLIQGEGAGYVSHLRAHCRP